MICPVHHPMAGVAELADATDSKSVGAYTPCRFDSCLRHSFPPAVQARRARSLIQPMHAQPL